MYEYTGYGLNQEKFSCSERFCYNDAERVYNYVTQELKIPPERIVIFGRSLGSGPSCYLAERHKVAGLILNSGFSSFELISSFFIFLSSSFSLLSACNWASLTKAAISAPLNPSILLSKLIL